ncbi:MAG: caspase family protein [Deltaproteobacteria bacterium]|nr:caspase family protein [Deltaproteobacteria bacterium]
MKRLAPTALLFALLATAGAGARAEETASGRRFAVVVGNNLGLPRSEPLRYAERDAERMADLLVEIGGVARENMTLLLGEGPDAVRSALDDMAARINAAGGDAVLVFYYSGHADSGWLRLGGRGLALEELKRRLEQTPAKVRVVIIDACQSGEITRQKGGRVVSPFLEEQPVRARGMVILTSAAAIENAQESDALGSSFFSHHLISGLRGPADTGGDGRVSVSEAYEYAYRFTVQETEGTASGPQHPTFLYALQGEGDVDLTSPSATRARIDLASDLEGTVLITGTSGRIEAEVEKAKGAALAVALAPGSYNVRLRTTTGLHAAEARLRDGDSITLGPSDFIDVPMVVATAKGAPEPVAVPVVSAHVRPLTEIPLGPGARWNGANDRAASPIAPAKADPGPQPSAAPAGVDEGPSLARRKGALLVPPAALGISLVAPGVPQLIGKRYADGALLLGLTVGSLVGAVLVGRSVRSTDSDPVAGAKLGGATALGGLAFYTYGYAAIDAFYSNTRGGPGAPDLDAMFVDVGLSLAPSLVRTPTTMAMSVDGGLGLGLAPHRNVVIGLRNLSVNWDADFATVKLGPELRGRGLALKNLMWSAGAGLGCEVQTARAGQGEDAGDVGWALYPYVAAGLHYFPARAWSLDFGGRAGVAIGTRRTYGAEVAPTAFSVEYVGGLTWYH